MLRDWIKGQVAAIETGILSFESAFLGHIMLPAGDTVLERIEPDNFLSLPPPPAAHGPPRVFIAAARMRSSQW
jgi:hypothetical protein